MQNLLTQAWSKYGGSDVLASTILFTGVISSGKQESARKRPIAVLDSIWPHAEILVTAWMSSQHGGLDDWLLPWHDSRLCTCKSASEYKMPAEPLL